MKLTLIHPCVGRRAGDRRYIRSWQMEPLAPAALAAITPDDVEVRFHDDRLEPIPFDEPTDLVGLSVETYTAQRSYQIASEYRKRGVPVVMGGFHPTLCRDEVERWADSVVVGEAENVWAEVIDDYRHGTPRKSYAGANRAGSKEADDGSGQRCSGLAGVRTDRSLFHGKRYLRVNLVETTRGCHFRCDFCAIQSFFGSTHTSRPVDDVVAEIQAARSRGRFFFVDDNITSNPATAKKLYRALIPLGIRWVSQASIHVAHDEELLELAVRSGCQGLLIGFESTDEETLRRMNKGFNTMRGGYEAALANLRKYRIRLYPTFVFGYDRDDRVSFARSLEFARHHRFYIAAFNHLTPFPGTPLYARLQETGQLLYGAWWTDPRYAYNDVPFRPARLSPDELRLLCLETRAAFYSWADIARRFADPVNHSSLFMARNFPVINWMLKREVRQRDRLPLGDDGWRGELLPADGFRRGASPHSRREIVAL